MKHLFYVLLFLTTTVQAQQSRPLQFREEIHDFGYIDQNSGPAVYQFDFTNISNRPIHILGVQASCGCTTPDWTKEPIPPGKNGFIQASFNPKGRPGFFNKSLTVTTDFDSNPLILQIKGQVSTDETKGGNADVEFRSKMGNWSLKSTSFNLGKVFIKDEFAAKEFPFMNTGQNQVTFQKSVTPNYIKVDVIPKTLNPGEKGKIRISYNGKQKNSYGFQSDNIQLYTDDALQPMKSFSIYATLEEFFPKMTPDELAKAPHLKVTETSYDMGRISQNQPGVLTIPVFNTGKNPLAIRAVQGNCSCITTSVTKNKLESGETATIKVTFNPQDRSGTNQKMVTIYSNDPENPVQRVTFTAYVSE